VTGRELSAPTIERLRSYARRVAGLLLPEHRTNDLIAAGQWLQEAAGATSADDLEQALRSRPDLRQRFLSDLTIGETYFFRSTDQLDAMVGVGRDRPQRPLSVWSAGCATGEEAYTVAMCFDRAGIAAEVVGTDLDPHAIHQARAARYGRRALRLTDIAARARWFRAAGDELAVDEAVRRRVRFAVHNLINDPDPEGGPFDIVLCRNVLLYFAPEAIELTLQRLHRAIARDGWLFVAPTELTLVPKPGFALRSVGTTLAYQRVDDTVVRTTDPHRYSRPTRTRPQQSTVDARCGEAVALHMSGDGHGALQLLDTIASEHPHAARPIELAARIHADLGDGVAAEALAALALEREPERASAHELRGRLAWSRGDDRAALEAFRRAAYLDRRHVLAHIGLAKVLDRLGDARRARASAAAASRLIASLAPDAIVDADAAVNAGAVRNLLRQLGARHE
jgi:chemotaxis protein methyltransferase CheR